MLLKECGVISVFTIYKISSEASHDEFNRLKIRKPKKRTCKLNVLSLLQIELISLCCYYNLWDDCTFARKRCTSLVPLILSLSTPTYGNGTSIRPILFSKREKYYRNLFYPLSNLCFSFFHFGNVFVCLHYSAI